MIFEITFNFICTLFAVFKKETKIQACYQEVIRHLQIRLGLRPVKFHHKDFYNHLPNNKIHRVFRLHAQIFTKTIITKATVNITKLRQHILWWSDIIYLGGTNILILLL